MFEGADASVEIGRYINFDENGKHEVFNNSSSQQILPTINGNWFTYTADGNTTITLNSTSNKLRFKVIDPKDFYVLFDTNDNPNFQYTNSNVGNVNKANLDMINGETYYIVVYSIENLPLGKSSYTLRAGEPLLTIGDDISINIPSMNVTAGNEYSVSFKVNAPDTVYAYNFDWDLDFESYKIINRSYTLLTPTYKTMYSSNKFVDFSMVYDKMTPVNGGWKLNFKAAKTASIPGTSAQFRIYYEV